MKNHHQTTHPRDALDFTHKTATALLWRKLARLLLAGHSVTKAAKMLKRERTHVSKIIANAEFKAFFSEQQHDYFRRVDQRLRHLLMVGVETHLKLLRHADPHVRLRALELVYGSIHGRYLADVKLFDQVPLEAESPVLITEAQARQMFSRRLDPPSTPAGRSGES